MTHHLPAEQRKISDRCFHPTGTIVELTKEEVERSVPERFEKIVRRDPHHLAVISAEIELTYDQLNRTANRLARDILQRSERTTEPVALLFDDDASIIPAMVGVLKAGSFFVALDPTIPESRLRHILDDSGARLIVADKKNLSFARDIAEECDLVRLRRGR